MVKKGLQFTESYTCWLEGSFLGMLDDSKPPLLHKLLRNSLNDQLHCHGPFGNAVIPFISQMLISLQSYQRFITEKSSNVL